MKLLVNLAGALVATALMFVAFGMIQDEHIVAGSLCAILGLIIAPPVFNRIFGKSRSRSTPDPSTKFLLGYLLVILMSFILALLTIKLLIL